MEAMQVARDSTDPESVSLSQVENLGNDSARETVVSAGLSDSSRHRIGLPQQLQTPGYQSIQFILVHGLLLGWERSQNVTLDLGLHRVPLAQVGPGVKSAPGRIRTADHLVRSRTDDFLGSYFSTT